MEMDGICWNEVESTFFIVKLQEVEQPEELMELNCLDVESHEKINNLKENEATTDHPWWVLFRHSSALSSFHGHSDLGVFVGSQNTPIQGKNKGKKGPKSAKHKKEPYPNLKREKEYRL